MKLALPGALRAQILAEARAAAPRECCGLVLGRHGGNGVAATALHRARNRAEDGNRFEIAPEDHFAAQRAARAAGEAVIGCYHSHPRGAPVPSAADLAGAGEEGFFWLIATPEGALAAFIYRGGVMTGTDLVASA